MMLLEDGMLPYQGQPDLFFPLPDQDCLVLELDSAHSP